MIYFNQGMLLLGSNHFLVMIIVLIYRWLSWYIPVFQEVGHSKWPKILGLITHQHIQVFAIIIIIIIIVVFITVVFLLLSRLNYVWYIWLSFQFWKYRKQAKAMVKKVLGEVQSVYGMENWKKAVIKGKQ